MDTPPDPDPTGAPPEIEAGALPRDRAGGGPEAWLADRRWRAALDGWAAEAARDGHARQPHVRTAGTAP